MEVEVEVMIAGNHENFSLRLFLLLSLSSSLSLVFFYVYSRVESIISANAPSMLRRSIPGQLPRRLFSVSAKMASATPMEDVMRDKVCLSSNSTISTSISNNIYPFISRLPTPSHPPPSTSATTRTYTHTTLQCKGRLRRRRISSVLSNSFYFFSRSKKKKE